MNKLSLRARLTITVTLIIAGIALMLTLVAMYNAGVINMAMANQISLATEGAPVTPDEFFEADVYIFDGSIENLDTDEDSLPVEVEKTETLPLFPFSTDTAIAGTTGLHDADSVSYVIALGDRFNYSSIWFMVLIVAAGGIITYFALGKALSPVRHLSEEISGITENDLNMRVTEFQAGDEINKLADSFNVLMERLEEAFSEQKYFAASAAHELKTPLAAIKANIGVLEMDKRPTNDDYAATLVVVKNQVERMTGLVDALMVMSAGDYDAVNEVNIGNMLDSILADYAHTVQDKNLDIKVDTQVQSTADVNQAMLRRVLDNVIGNAVRYTGSGGSIAIAANENASGYTFTVADNGPGIAEEDRQKVFQPFYRVDPSRSRKSGGAGLGLAIAKNMIEKLGGTISVDANEPTGSVFTVRLPKERSSPTA